MHAKYRLLSFLICISLFIQPLMHAHVALQNMPLDCVHHVPSIITKNEWEELQLDWLVSRLDMTQTSMGSWAFKQMLHPVASREEIKRRQVLVQALTRDTQLYNDIQRCLRTIQQAESFVIEKMKMTDDVTGIETEYVIKGGLLSYWDNAQYKEADKLFAKIAQLYYQSTLVPKKEYLNTHTTPLECSMAMEMARTGLNILYVVGIQGILEDFTVWMFSDNPNAEFDAIRGFVDGIKQPWRDINPFPSEIGLRYDPNGTGSFKQALFHGTAGDRFIAIKKNYNSKSRIKMWWLGRQLHKLWGVGNKFNADGDLVLENRENPYTSNGANRKKPGLIRSAATNLFAGAGTAFYSYWRLGILYEMIKGTCRYWMILVKSLRQLQTHLVRVARAMEAIKELHKIVESHEELRNSCIAQHLNEALENPSENLTKLFEVLSSSTFKSRTNGIIYSRGRTLMAHKLMERCKNELIPVLRAVGELDAMSAMAANIKAHADTDRRFSFVEFIDAPEATIAFENSWVPVLLDDAVPNDIYFGGEHPTKLIITGPNGGGKSTVLKALGHSVVLAQSWGIVPASRGTMTMFNAVRTCLHPHESLQTGLSTFMAEKGRVDEIVSFVQQNRFEGFKVMVLLDEPFKGTVDKESAERIYNFGKEIAGLPESIVCIATHVKKPIYLAEDTNGAFSNRHVVISQNRNGSYKREFRLADGPAWWWFEDKEKRSNFIDWLGQETIKVKQHAEEMGRTR
jgi:ABC-type multidrug transport system fused ATPase/permease subunit